MEPTTPTTEPTFDESLAQVMQTLPPVIRQYLAEEKYTPIARELIAKYQLRIDQGGILEREIMLLLMGIETPDEFMKALGDEAHLSAESVKRITNEVNELIFIPLRKKEEERGMGSMPVAPVETAAVQPVEDLPSLPELPVAEAVAAPEAPRPEPVVTPTPITSYQRDPYREAVDEPADEV